MAIRHFILCRYAIFWTDLLFSFCSQSGIISLSTWFMVGTILAVLISIPTGTIWRLIDVSKRRSRACTQWSRTCKCTMRKRHTFLQCYQHIFFVINIPYAFDNRKEKRVIVSFRGSRPPGESRDWATNCNAECELMTTPKQARAKMDGKLKERVLVHHGFYSEWCNIL